MSTLLAICTNCRSQETLFEIDRPLVSGTVLTAIEMDKVVEFQDEPCSNCGQPLKGALLWSPELQAEKQARVA